MRPLGFMRLAHLGFTASVLFVAPRGQASPVDPTTVTIDLGTVAYAINVNASIYNPAFPSLAQTYTYSQLLYNPANPTVTLDNGNSIDEELAVLGYVADNGMLNYYFQFPSASSGGTYTQDGSPPYSPGSPDIGEGLFQSFTATSVSGTTCAGDNNLGATVSLDPTNSAATYATILGCDGLTGLNPGFPAPTTTTVEIYLGSLTSGDTVDVFYGDVNTTVWELSGQVGEPSSVPEPSALWLEAAGILGLCAFRVRKRFRATDASRDTGV